MADRVNALGNEVRARGRRNVTNQEWGGRCYTSRRPLLMGFVLPGTARIRYGSGEAPIDFYAFDLLQLNGKDLRNLPIEERKAKQGFRM
jgi:hypothetical protein